jgi:hypothetical protein
MEQSVQPLHPIACEADQPLSVGGPVKLHGCLQNDMIDGESERREKVNKFAGTQPGQFADDRETDLH